MISIESNSYPCIPRKNASTSSHFPKSPNPGERNRRNNRIQKFPLLKRSHPPLPSTPPRRTRGMRKSVWNTITRMTRYSLPPIPIRKRGACCSFGAEIHSIWLKAGADRLGRGSAPSPL